MKYRKNNYRNEWDKCNWSR